MSYNFKEIGKRICYERNNSFNLNQTDFGELFGLCRKRIGEIENGKGAPPDLQFLVTLCEKLAEKEKPCDIGYLLCEYNERQKEIHNLVIKTGLSEKAINYLVSMDRTTNGILSQIIENDKMPQLLSRVWSLSNVKKQKKENALTIYDIDEKIPQIEFAVTRKFEQIINDITE